MATQPSEMSFSVSDGAAASSTTAPPRTGSSPAARNLVSPSFHRMVRDLVRFNREARGAGGPQRQRPVPRRVPRRAGGYSRALRGAADRAPGLGGVVGRPGADVGVPRELPGRVLRQPRHVRAARPAALAHRRRGLGPLRRAPDRAARPRRIRLSTPVRSDRARWPRRGGGAAGGEPERFDEVVLATHSDQALAMLADPSPRRARGARRDPLPAATTWCSTPTARCCRGAGARGRAGTSTSQDEPAGRTTVTYHMNRLQSLRARPRVLRDAEPRRARRSRRR